MSQPRKRFFDDWFARYANQMAEDLRFSSVIRPQQIGVSESLLRYVRNLQAAEVRREQEFREENLRRASFMQDVVPYRTSFEAAYVGDMDES